MKHNKLKELILLFLILIIVVIGAGAFGKYAFSETEFVVSYQEEPKLPIEDTIKNVCDEAGVPWIVCIRVAICESGLNEFFSKDIKGVGRDRGVFALNSVHYKHISDDQAFNAEEATKVFAEAYLNGRAGDWLCYNQIFGKK